MPRNRHSSSDSSSADSSDDSRHNRVRRGKQQQSADRQRKQRSDSSDSSPHSHAIPSKAHMSHKPKKKSPIHKRQSFSEESDSSPSKDRKGGNRSRLSEPEKKRHSVEGNEKRKRSGSRNSSRSPDRTKKSSRKRSPSGKRERRKSSSDSDTNEPSSPSKPLLASRVNYMKSLNPDRSKRVVKQKSPSRRKVQSLADDYNRQEQSSRWRVESLADDYRKNRYRTSDRDDRDRRERDERSPRRRTPRRSPKRRSADRESPEQDRSPIRSSQRRRSQDRSKERQSSPVKRSPERKSKSAVKQRSPKRRSSEDRFSERQISPTKRSVEKRSPKRSYQKFGSPEMERSPVRISPNKQRSQRRRSLEEERSPVRTPDRQRDPTKRSVGSLQDRQRSPMRRPPERQRAPARRSVERPLVRQSPDRQNSFDKRSSDRHRSAELHSPLKRDPARRPAPERGQRRNSPEAILPRRLSADRIPQERQLASPRVPVGKLSGRPMGRRRSEEMLQSRLSSEKSFSQRSPLERPLHRRSPAISPLRPLERRRSTERSFLVRRSMEHTSDQRYLNFSPPRLIEQRTRARSLERMPRRPENDRFLRDSQRQMQSNRFRRDSDRGLYDDIPEPLAVRRSPPLESRWKYDSEYSNRYRDDMDLPQRSVYVDRAVSVRVLNDRPTDAGESVPFRYRDHRGNQSFNRVPNFQRKWQGKSNDSFNISPDRGWSGVRNSRPVDRREFQRDDDRHIDTLTEPKRRRLGSYSRKGSFSPKRNNRSVESASRSMSPVGLGSELTRENRRATRQQSSSESDEEYAVPGSKLSSTVTMVTRKHSRSRSPALQSKTKKRISASLEREKIRSNRDVSESPERSRGEKVDPVLVEKDKLDRKRPRSLGRPVRSKTDRDSPETAEKLIWKKDSSRSPRKSRRDQKEPDELQKDRSGESKKSSRSPVRSPIKRLESNISESERAKSDRSSRSYQLSPRDRIDSEVSEQEQNFTRVYEMERMDSFVSTEQDFGRSYERERFDSTTSEQDMRDRSKSVDGGEEGQDVRDSDPESGELTDSDEETQKRNALIKSLVNKPSLEVLEPDEEERQKIEDEHYLEKKRQEALARLEGEKETVASTVVKVTDSRRDKGDDGRGERDDRRDSRRERNRDEKRDEKRDSKRKRHSEDISGNKPETSQPEQEPATKKSKPDPTGIEALTMRTGGAYIPPARLRAMQASITDKSSVAYQRMSWEALKKSINGLINKVNVSNIEFIVREIFQENIVRGRGLMARSIIQAQAASPTFTHVYAALVAIVNTKFPQNGELVLRRLVVQFRRGFKRNDKTICLSTTRFVAHLVNQQVAHEVLALEILTLLLETPTDDSVEIAVGFLKECGQKLTEVTPRGVNAIFERLRNVLHEGTIDTRVQYMVEVMFAVRKDGFKDHPSVLEDLDLVEEEDQFTHLLTLEDAGDPENMLNVFKADPDFLENEEKYKILKKEILDEGSSDEEGEGGSGSDSDSEDSEDNEGEGAKQTIIDQTETNLVALRRTIYLTIQSSLDFEECAHKLMKMELKPGQEVELCNMVLDCCAQMRTYEKFFGLLAQRFCMIDKKYIEPFQIMFKEQYETIHRLETNKLRNVAKFFAHLLHTDAISWGVLSCIRLNEEDTSSASRIFIKILIQELSEYMGLPNLNERLKDPTLQEYFEGLLPRDNPRNTRFAINFFTTIGLGGLTDDLRDHLKNVSKKLMEQKQEEQEAAESSSDSERESSASESNSIESSGSSEEERKKKKKKRGAKGKEKEKSKKDKRGKKSLSNGAVEKQGKKSKKGKSGAPDESVQKRAERLRQLANYAADANEVNIEDSRTRAREDSIEQHKGKDGSKGRKEIRVSRNRDNDSFDRPRDVSGEREVRGRRERMLSDDDNYREMETGRRRYREVERQVSYDDSESDRRGRLDRSFDKVDRYDNRYQDLDGMNARDNDNFGEGYDRRGRNEYRNLDRGDDRRQKRGFNASNMGYRNNRGRPRGDGRLDRNFGSHRSEERLTRMPREDRRDDRRRRR